MAASWIIVKSSSNIPTPVFEQIFPNSLSAFKHLLNYLDEICPNFNFGILSKDDEEGNPQALIAHPKENFDDMSQAYHIIRVSASRKEEWTIDLSKEGSIIEEEEDTVSETI